MRCRPSAPYTVPSVSAVPIAWTTPPVIWPAAPRGLSTRPTSLTAATSRTRTTPVARSTFTRAAWQKNVGEAKASKPRRPTHAEASCSGFVGAVPEPAPSRSPPSSWTCVATAPIVTRRSGLPTTEMAPSRSSRSVCAASSISAAAAMTFVRTSRAASTTARPALNVVWLPALPVSYGPASVSW